MRVPFLPTPVLAFAVLVLGGCVGGGPEPVARTPAMPRMRPSTERVEQSATPNELTAAARTAAAAGDFAGAARALQQIDDSERRPRAAAELAAELARGLPQRAVDLAHALPEGAAQRAVIEVAAEALTQRGSAEALALATETAGSAAAGLRRAIVSRLVRADARGTIVAMRGQPASVARDEALAIGVGEWARRDADAALAWLREQPDDALRRRLTSTVAFEVAQTRPQQAIAVADLLPAGRERWLLYSAIAQTWVAVDARAALGWAGNLPAGEARDAAYAGADTGLGVPASRRLATGPGIRGGATRGGGPMLPVSPELSSPDFAAWLATQRRGMSREEAILEYVRQRGLIEPATVGQWLTTLPGGPARDRATEAYVEGLMNGAPGEAVRWLSSQPRAGRDDALLDRATQTWLRTNPDAAAAWLEQSTLPPDRKAQLLRDAGR